VRKSRWGIGRAAICGALTGVIWVGWKTIQSGVPWVGEGLFYNINEMGAGMVGGAALGIVVVLIRNRSLY
jgi:hypothetical protein